MYKEFNPHPSLASIVKYYWIEKDRTESERILPDGCVIVLINLGDDIQISNKQSSHTISSGCVIGPHEKYIEISNTGRRHLIGIKFRVGKSYNFLNFAVSKITNDIYELNLLLNGETNKIRKQLINCRKPNKIPAILNHFLINKIGLKSSTPIDVVDAAIDRIQIKEKRMLIKNICWEIGISNKHLITLFRENIGISPKLLHRISKFQKAINEVQNTENINWSEIVYNCHYFDQAHMINEFQHFCGATPKQYALYKDLKGQRLIINNT